MRRAECTLWHTEVEMFKNPANHYVWRTLAGASLQVEHFVRHGLTDPKGFYGIAASLLTYYRPDSGQCLMLGLNPELTKVHVYDVSNDDEEQAFFKVRRKIYALEDELFPPNKWGGHPEDFKREFEERSPCVRPRPAPRDVVNRDEDGLLAAHLVTELNAQSKLDQEKVHSTRYRNKLIGLSSQVKAAQALLSKPLKKDQTHSEFMKLVQ